MKMSMDITKIHLSLDSIAGGKEVLLLDFKEQFTYQNNQLTDKISGYKCRILLPSNGYEQIFVKVADMPKIPEELLSNGEPINITFEDFEGHIYRDYKNSSYALTCRAKSIVLLK